MDDIEFMKKAIEGMGFVMEDLQERVRALEENSNLILKRDNDFVTFTEKQTHVNQAIVQNFRETQELIKSVNKRVTTIADAVKLLKE